MVKKLGMERIDALVMNKLVALWVIKNDSQLLPSGFIFDPKSLPSAG
jgi:hypothetical protein